MPSLSAGLLTESSLSLHSPTARRITLGRIGKVELLGVKGDVKWTREPGGLRISVPQDPPCRHAYCFKILPA